MHSFLYGAAAGFTLLLLASAWTAGTKASRLLYYGSAERLARRSRKLLSWTVLASLSAIGAAAAVYGPAGSPGSASWIDRAGLHLPMLALALAGIWLSALPGVWRLWRGAMRLNGAAVPANLAKLSASPAIIVPYQAAAIGACLSLYSLFDLPAPWSKSSVAAPALVCLALAAGLWLLHHRRVNRVAEARSAATLTFKKSEPVPALLGMQRESLQGHADVPYETAR
ncbi:hypothetical protein [Cohnella sp. JJ-181]|uniref:hypothetical protein n=1 Tax=Cohnella rhizoplanae TaxID=2974897 RepID=UPI0022FF5699|nr:hypothetical protein [Cohnella sp. JJ-181]CAI6037880.1 hypothetical protein COHCIP112018_00965 [Cohnella sp. JJ-181]